MNVKYFYVRNPKKKRDITICSNLTKNDDKWIVSYGFALRCNHDKFRKKEGRELSFNRMIDLDKKYSGKFEIDAPNYYGIAIEILSQISENRSTPNKYLDDLNEEILFLVASNETQNGKFLHGYCKTNSIAV